MAQILPKQMANYEVIFVMLVFQASNLSCFTRIMKASIKSSRKMLESKYYVSGSNFPSGEPEKVKGGAVRMKPKYDADFRNLEMTETWKIENLARKAASYKWSQSEDMSNSISYRYRLTKSIGAHHILKMAYIEP